MQHKKKASLIDAFFNSQALMFYRVDLIFCHYNGMIKCIYIFSFYKNIHYLIDNTTHIQTSVALRKRVISWENLRGSLNKGVCPDFLKITVLACGTLEAISFCP